MRWAGCIQVAACWAWTHAQKCFDVSMCTLYACGVSIDVNLGFGLSCPCCWYSGEEGGRSAFSCKSRALVLRSIPELAVLSRSMLNLWAAAVSRGNMLSCTINDQELSVLLLARSLSFVRQSRRHEAWVALPWPPCRWRQHASFTRSGR